MSNWIDKIFRTRKYLFEKEYKVSYSSFKKEVLPHILNQKKVNAVKALREITGLGLKESKETIDKVEQELPKWGW